MTGEVSTRGTGGTKAGPNGPVLFSIAALMLVFAPLVRGGNRPMPLLVLEIAALLALVIAGLSSRATPRPPALLAGGIAILLLVPLVQLLPVPMTLWSTLPGHAPFANALESSTGTSGGWHALSLHGEATEYAWLAMLPSLAIFVIVQRVDRNQLRRLVLVFVGVSMCEALLGVMQLGAPASSLLHLGNPFGNRTATGTFVNKNHFAALMAMTLPVLMALWAAEVVPPRNSKGEIIRDHPRHRDVKLARRLALSVFVMTMVVALLFTGSRAGTTCGLAALALASVALVWKAGSVHARAVLILVAICAVMLGGYVGLTPVLERFAANELSVSYESRMRIADATIGAALDFLPLGSGLGTFADAFQRYQAGTIPGFVDHAHNDYAEAFLEMGVAAVAVFALFVAAYVLRWREILKGRLSRSLGYLQVGAGLGMFALIAHGLFDFNLHIPANALAFSFLAGVFWFIPAEDHA